MKLFEAYGRISISDGPKYTLSKLYCSVPIGDQEAMQEFAIPSPLPPRKICYFFRFSSSDGAPHFGCSIVDPKSSVVFLVSPIAYFQTLKIILTSISASNSCDTFGMYLVSNVPMPPPGVISVKFNILGQDYSIQRPPPNRPAPFDLQFWLPFATFAEDDLISIFTAILLERKVVFISLLPSVPAVFIETFLALLYPFRWEFPVLYSLKKSQAKLLSDPSPFIVGAESSLFPAESFPPGTFVVSIDTASIICPPSLLQPRLPQKPYSKLLAAVQKFKQLFSSSNRQFHLAAPAAISQSDLPSYNSKNVKSGDKFKVAAERANFPFVSGLTSDMSIGQDCPDLFESFSDVIKGFTRCLVVVAMDYKVFSDGEQAPRPSKDPFQVAFLQTRMAAEMERRSLNIGKSIDTIDRARPVYFKEQIASKRNRSAMSKKAETPFLSAPNWRQRKQFKCEIPEKEGKIYKVAELVSSIEELKLVFDYGESLNESKGAFVSSAVSLIEPAEKPKEALKGKDGVEEAALKIQRLWRAFLPRITFRKIKSNVIVCESLAKGILQKAKFEEMKAAAKKIQGRFRTFLARKEFLSEKKKAIQIESAFRMVLAQKRATQVKEGIIKIQSFSKMALEKSRYERTVEAAVLIQSILRGIEEKRNFEKIMNAIKIIARFVKKVTQKGNSETESKARRSSLAVLAIQRLWRYKRDGKIRPPHLPMQLKNFIAIEIGMSLMYRRKLKEEALKVLKSTQSLSLSDRASFLMAVAAHGVESKSIIEAVRREKGCTTSEKRMDFYLKLKAFQKTKIGKGIDTLAESLGCEAERKNRKKYITNKVIEALHGRGKSWDEALTCAQVALVVFEKLPIEYAMKIDRK